MKIWENENENRFEYYILNQQWIRLIERNMYDFMFVQGRKTALHFAAYHGRFDAVQLLVQSGANIETRDMVRRAGAFQLNDIKVEFDEEWQ